MAFDKLAWQRSRRRATGNSDTKRYEKTRPGFLMRTYRNMQSRVTGVQKNKAHLYLGLELLDRQDFYDWSKNDPAFRALHEAWVESGYERRLTPSINRINPTIGYTQGNIEWLTLSENSRLGALRG